MGVSGRLSDNDQLASANIVWTAPNVEDVTIVAPSSGSNTNAVKYLNKGGDGTGYSLVADQDVEIVSLKSGDTEFYLGDPRQVGANARRTRVLKHQSFTTLVIRILTANTNVQLEVF